MEREEAGSLRDALEDMDAAERKKAAEAALAEEKLRELAMEEEERIQLAAQKEASELVFAHLHPEEVKRRQEEEERRRQTGYRYHLRKGSYQHARAASVGREYKGDDAIIVDLNSRPGMPSRTFSDESIMRSANRNSMRRESSDHSSRPSLENRQSTDEPRGRPPAKSSGKSYGTLSGTISGVASKSRSWSARRKSGGGKRNISGEINTIFHPDQIWEEPETSRESSKNRAKQEQAEKSREDIYNGAEPLSSLKRNPANRVQFQEESKSESTTQTLENAGLPVQKIDRFEIFRNPPSQSRNPLYTANDPPKPRTPSPDKNLPDLHMKDGKEIRNEELRKATTKSLKDRSEKLPTPTAVSDNRGRPIVSFDKKWMPAEEKAALEKEKEKALLDLVKNKADSTPAGTPRAIIPELIQGGESRNEGATSTKTGTTGLSAVEIAKRKIFRLAEETSLDGPKSFGERTSRSCSPQRRSGGRAREGGRKEGARGEKGEEEERQGHFEVVGCEADKEYVLGKIGHPGSGKVNDSDAEVNVGGKWIVETRKGVSTFRIEDEKTLKEQQRRKDGFPYRLGSSAESSTSSFAAANPRPTSRDGSKKSTPRTSISQEKLEADISPVATPLVDLVKKTPPAAAAEPAKLIFPSLEADALAPAPLVLLNRNVASIAPPAAAARPAQIERQSTLMARSPFARPRGESFMSRRSIFQPEKSVPASPPSGTSAFAALENEKPIGPSHLSVPRPRPSFLTRTRSRSSVSGHSVFALKKPASVTPSATPIKEDKTPTVVEEKTVPSAQVLLEKKSTEEARPPITRARSSENSTPKALPQLPPNSAQDQVVTPAESPQPLSKVAQLAAPFGQSLLSAARPRPSFLTRTRSRSSVAGHSVFALKKPEPAPVSISAPPAKEEPKPLVPDETPGRTPSPLAEVKEVSMKEVRPLIIRARSSDVSVSRALPPLPPAEVSKETSLASKPVAVAAPKIPAPAAESPKPLNHITNSHLSRLNTRPSFLTRTRSRSSVAGHSPYSLKGQESSSPLAETSSPTPPAHDEDRPPIARAKSSENAIPKATSRQLAERALPPSFNTRSPFARPSPGPKSLPAPPEMSLDNACEQHSSAPPPIATASTSASAAETQKPVQHITNAHLSAARSRPSFLTRTRSRSSVAGHSPYSLKGEKSTSPVAENSSPTPPAHDEVKPPFNRSKSSENTIKTTSTHSIEEQDKPRFAPRSPFARPSLGPTSLSTPPEISLNKMGSLAARSPFGRPGGARSSMSTVSVPSDLKEIGPSPSVRRSPFDRPVTSHGSASAPHARSSLGTEVRKSIDDGDARPKSREGFSANSAKAKLPWMRANRGPTDESARPRSSTIESFKIDNFSERAVSRGEEVSSIKKTTGPKPEKILQDVGVTESPPPLEVTVNTADVAALYQDVLESPTKVPKVVVKTADIAEQYDLVLNESASLDEKASVPAPAAPVISKAPDVVMDRPKSSLSGARPLPMRPSGPRQSAASSRRTPRHEERVVAPPPLVKAQTVPEKVVPPPPPSPAIEHSPEKKGHKKSTSSISTPSTHAAVLAPPVETLSEVRPPAPEDAVMEQKPLPTIYGPPRPETPSGFAPSLSISAPAIAIRSPSPAPPSDAPMISVSAPAINVSEPSGPTVSAPPRPQSIRPLPQPTRPLPQPGSSARPLPRPTSSSGHRPLPAPVNARPMPSPSSRVAPPPNLARPSSDSTSHWSPAPAPAGARATATCHACNLPIEGRVIALAGLKERWHPACMQCHVCSTALADFEISPEPSFARAARLARIEAREAGEYVAEGESTDGDKKLRFYCHLDWHEAFAPRCQHCKTPIIGEHITALGGKHYHYGHFFCCECGDPFMQGKPHVELDGYAWCTGCVEKRTLRRAPKCGLCRKNVVGEVVQALGKEFHAECFRCGDCGDSFVGGEIYLRDDVGVSCRECMERWAKNQRRGSVRG